MENILNNYMKRNHTGILNSRALSICEEFCRYIVVDEKRHTILTNTCTDFYDELVKRMKTLGYFELFSACVHPKNTVTSTFVPFDFT
jgi:hypothetical protein